MRRAVSFLFAFALCASVFGGFVAPSASAATKTVYLETVDIATGEPITTACYVIIDASEEGCDENGDGLIRYQGVSSGDFTLTQTERPPGYLPVGDFPVTIADDGEDQTITIKLARADGVNRDTVTVAVAPVDRDTGEPIYGACFIFHGGSEEGCDENGDGQIDYRGVAVGTYHLGQTEPIDGYRTNPDTWVTVASNRTITVRLRAEGGNPPPGDDQVNVAIVTRDDNGTLLPGACYIINNASIEGCDENGDGQVDYRGVVPGAYTVTQTSAPSGFARVGNFSITITSASQQVFTINQAGASARSTNISLVAVDAETGERIYDFGTCFQLRGGSDEGCDNNADGQVDFFGAAPGRYFVDATGVPDGYLAYDVPLDITVKSIANQQFFEIPFIPE